MWHHLLASNLTPGLSATLDLTPGLLATLDLTPGLSATPSP